MINFIWNEVWIEYNVDGWVKVRSVHQSPAETNCDSNVIPININGINTTILPTVIKGYVPTVNNLKMKLVLFKGELILVGQRAYFPLGGSVLIGHTDCTTEEIKEMGIKEITLNP